MPRRNSPDRRVLPPGRPKATGLSLADSLAAALARAIARGEVATGELMPPERTLAERHRLGRVTVRSALARLVRDGVLECLPGVGYVVARRRAQPADTRPVGLIYGDLGGRTLAASRSLSAIESALAASGRALLVGASGLTGEGEDACIRRFRSAGVGALVVAPAVSGARSLELDSWLRRGLPAVLEGHPGRWLLSSQVAERADHVDIDNRGGVRAALEHLWKLGHRSFAFVSESPVENSLRHSAFREFARERGLDAKQSVVAASDLATDARRAGREGFARLMTEGRVATAVVCPNDDTALGVIDAARAAGLDCPQDISVVGFGNESVEGPAAIARLTTIEFSREELAAEVVRCLAAQAEGGRRSPARVVVPARLVVRESCAAARSVAMA